MKSNSAKKWCGHIKMDYKRTYVFRKSERIIFEALPRFAAILQECNFQLGDKIVVALNSGRFTPLTGWPGATPVAINLAAVTVAVTIPTVRLRPYFPLVPGARPSLRCRGSVTRRAPISANGD